jgi:hypothetical protein
MAFLTIVFLVIAEKRVEWQKKYEERLGNA